LFVLKGRSLGSVYAVLLALTVSLQSGFASADASLGIDHYLNEMQRSLAAPRTEPRVMRIKVSGRPDNFNIERVAPRSIDLQAQTTRPEGLAQTLSSGASLIPSVLIEIWHRPVY